MTIINEKPVDRNDTILSELDILKKALKEKKMNKEKTELLAKWIRDEKTKIKEETTDLETGQVDEIQIDMSNSGCTLHNEYFETYTKGEKEKNESLNIDKREDLGNFISNEDTLVKDEDIHVSSEPSTIKALNIKKKWLDEYTQEELMEAYEEATPNKMAKESEDKEDNLMEEERNKHRFLSGIEKAFMESIEMEIPDSKKEEGDLMQEFNTFSGHAIDDQVMKICQDFEFEIEVNGEMKKANEIINLMDQASQLNEKALFECSNEELKEKVENSWNFNKEEFDQNIGDLDFNRITISEDEASDLNDLKEKWRNLHTEIEKIGSEEENIRHVDSEEEKYMDTETDNINIMLNTLSNFNECNELFNAKLDQINLQSDDMKLSKNMMKYQY